MWCLFSFRIFFFAETFCFEAQAARDQIAIPQWSVKTSDPLGGWDPSGWFSGYIYI